MKRLLLAIFLALAVFIVLWLAVPHIEIQAEPGGYSGYGYYK